MVVLLIFVSSMLTEIGLEFIPWRKATLRRFRARLVYPMISTSFGFSTPWMKVNLVQLEVLLELDLSSDYKIGVASASILNAVDP